MFTFDTQSVPPGQVDKGVIEIIPDEKSATGTVLWTCACIAPARSIDVMPEPIQVR